MALRRPAARGRRAGEAREEPPAERGGRVRRRPAGLGRPGEPAPVPAPEAGRGRKEEAGKTFEEGTLTPCHQVPLDVLRKRLPVEVNGSYWGQSGGISGLVQGVHVRGREDVELEVLIQGTNLESILKWASGCEDKLMRIHLCGGRCPSPLDAENLLHGEFMCARKGEDLLWMMNLVAEGTGGGETAPIEPPIDKGRKEERKEKKDKERGRSKEKDRSRKRRRRKSGERSSEDKRERKRISLRGEAKKGLKAVYGGTGIDPDPRFRRKFAAKAAKKAKKRGHSSSSSHTSDTKSQSTSEKSIELFAEDHKIRRMGKLAPGALTCAAFREIQNSLLTASGGVWDSEDGVIPPVACQYYRQIMQSRLQGGQAREALTVAWSLDLLLQGRTAEACDVLTQRFKSLEMSGAGASWMISQKVELVPPERPVLSSRAETREAIRENREEQKTRSEAARPRGKGDSGNSSWRDEDKGKGKEGKNKGKKGKEKGEGKRAEK